jgi:hypothetical protein
MRVKYLKISFLDFEKNNYFIIEKDKKQLILRNLARNRFSNT